jgi:hypothetical protein
MNRTSLSSRGLIVTFLVACVTQSAFVVVPYAASNGSPETSREAYRQKSKQSRAHQLTVDMIGTVLSAQLQQLEDNQLSDDPLYGDLKDMSGRMNAVAEEHMSEVVKMLSEAMDNPQADRAGLMKLARKRMQEVLDRLLYERDLLRQRRMQAALTGTLRIMISKQETTRAATLKLKTAGEETIISIAGSQQEIVVLFKDYKSLLNTVSGWAGELGAIGAEAKRLLRDSGVDASLGKTTGAMLATKFDQAGEFQQEVIDGLEGLLRSIRQLEDPASIEEDMIDAVQLLMEEQEALMAKTKASDLDKDAEMEPILEGQTLLVQKLRRLSGVVAISDRMETLSRMAEEHADLATSTLFEAEKKLTVDHQNKVIGSLAEMLVELENWAGRLDKFLTAEEYHKLYEMLTSLRGEMVKTLDQHRLLAGVIEAAPKDAVDGIKPVVEALASYTANPELPRYVWLRIRTAEDEVKQEEAALKRNPEDALARVPQSDRAIRHAIGEVTETQAQARRNAMAVELGELNRGTESLMRASAAVLRTGEVLGKWGDAPEHILEQSRVLLSKVRAIASHVSEGVHFTAPQAVKALAAP